MLTAIHMIVCAVCCVRCSDENGAFVHGAINIGADGMVINSGASASNAAATNMQLSTEEAEELKLLRKDTKLEDLEVSGALTAAAEGVERATDWASRISPLIFRCYMHLFVSFLSLLCV